MRCDLSLHKQRWLEELGMGTSSTGHLGGVLAPLAAGAEGSPYLTTGAYTSFFIFQEILGTAVLHKYLNLSTSNSD